MKVHNFWGELTDSPAKKEALVPVAPSQMHALHTLSIPTQTLDNLQCFDQELSAAFRFLLEVLDGPTHVLVTNRPIVSSLYGNFIQPKVLTVGN